MRLGRLAAPLAAVALLGGCGGGGGGRLTASQYTQQATKICRASQAQTGRLARPRRPQEFKPFLQKGIDITRKGVGELEKLKPPKSLDGRHRAVIDAERQAIGALQRIADGLRGDAQDAARLRSAAPQLERVANADAAKLRAAGLGACAA